MTDRYEDDMIGHIAVVVAAALTGRTPGARSTAYLTSRLGGDRLTVEAELREALRFDPVGLAEIAVMTGQSKQNLKYLMSSAPMSNGTVIQRPAGSPPPPRPVQLARMKVWRRSEVAVWWAAIGREVSWTDAPEGEGV